DTCLARLLRIICWQFVFIRVRRPLIPYAGLSLTWHRPGPRVVAHPDKKLRNTARSAISGSQTNIGNSLSRPIPPEGYLQAKNIRREGAIKIVSDLPTRDK